MRCRKTIVPCWGDSLNVGQIDSKAVHVLAALTVDFKNVWIVLFIGHCMFQLL